MAGQKHQIESVEIPQSKKRTRATNAPQQCEVDDEVLQETMLRILQNRKQGATCCPSEIPRSLPLADWRAWMEPTRRVAQRLAREGVIDILQRGAIVPDLDSIRGPIRLRLRPPPAPSASGT